MPRTPKNELAYGSSVQRECAQALAPLGPGGTRTAPRESEGRPPMLPPPRRGGPPVAGERRLLAPLVAIRSASLRGGAGRAPHSSAPVACNFGRRATILCFLLALGSSEILPPGAWSVEVEVMGRIRRIGKQARQEEPRREEPEVRKQEPEQRRRRPPSGEKGISLPTLVRVDPPEGTFRLGRKKRIRVLIQDAPPIQGLKVRLTFDPEKVEVGKRQRDGRLQVTHGSWIKGTGRPMEGGVRGGGRRLAVMFRPKDSQRLPRPLVGGGSVLEVTLKWKGSTSTDPENPRAKHVPTHVGVEVMLLGAEGGTPEVTTQGAMYCLEKPPPRSRRRLHLGAREYPSGHVVGDDRDYKILRWIHEQRFLTRRSMGKMWFSTKDHPLGSFKSLDRRLGVLKTHQLIKRYYDPKTDYAVPYLLDEKGWELLKEKKWTLGLDLVKEVTAPGKLEHDERLAELRWWLEESGLCREWEGERALAKRWKKLTKKQIGRKITTGADALMTWGEEGLKVALEYERKLKRWTEYRTLLQRYQTLFRAGEVDWVLMVFEEEKDLRGFRDELWPRVGYELGKSAPLDYFKMMHGGWFKYPEEKHWKRKVMVEELPRCSTQWAFAQDAREGEVTGKRGRTVLTQKGKPKKTYSFQIVESSRLDRIGRFESWGGDPPGGRIYPRKSAWTTFHSWHEPARIYLIRDLKRVPMVRLEAWLRSGSGYGERLLGEAINGEDRTILTAYPDTEAKRLTIETVTYQKPRGLVEYPCVLVELMDGPHMYSQAWVLPEYLDEHEYLVIPEKNPFDEEEGEEDRKLKELAEEEAEEW